MSSAVRARDLAKTYVRIAGMKQRLRALAGRSTRVGHGISALEPISFDIRVGESTGLIGDNGSGKSTLLKVLAGVLAPTAGTAEVFGRVSALLELGTGFHPEFTGRENILHAGFLAGLSREDVRRLEPEIIDFAELAHAIDRPLKTYSSGMAMRLAFSVAHAVHPDILLIDEVLAVGDAMFRLKSFERLQAFARSGGTFILVSHDLSSILRLCSRCLWLEDGKLRMDGPAREVGEAYQDHVMSLEDERILQARANSAANSRNDLRIAGLELREPGGASRHQFRPNVPLEVAVRVESPIAITRARVRIHARRRDHLCLVELASPVMDLGPGLCTIVAELGRHRFGPGELYWSATLERGGEPLATFGTSQVSGDPVPMGIIARPDDVLERGALRHHAMWQRIEG